VTHEEATKWEGRRPLFLDMPDRRTTILIDRGERASRPEPTDREASLVQIAAADPTLPDTLDLAVKSGAVVISAFQVKEPFTLPGAPFEPVRVRSVAGAQAKIRIGGTETMACQLRWNEPAEKSNHWYFTAYASPSQCDGQRLAAEMSTYLH